MAVDKIFIGYRTRPAAGVEKVLPEFKAPSHYKDPAKIAAYVAEARAAFTANAQNMPYTGTFDEVVLIDGKHHKVLQWSHAAAEEGGKPLVSVRVRNYLLKHFPDAWTDDGTLRKGGPAVIFVGFDPRTFLKILGLECSLPAVNRRCPLGLWYSNTDHRDITEAVLPKEFTGLTLPYVLKMRRPTDGETAKRWDEALADWPGPGVFPEKDARITVELATQLGFVERVEAENG